MSSNNGHSTGGAAAAVPAILDPTNAQHVWAVCSSIQGSTQSTSNEVGATALPIASVAVIVTVL
jgi:hypothetical protein